MRLEFLADRRIALSAGIGLVAGLSGLVAGAPGDGGNPAAVSFFHFDEEVLS